MQTLTTSQGVALETLRENERRWAERVAATAATALALVLAGAVCAAGLRGCCRPAAEATAAETRECLERNIRLGVYGDELCGFMPDSGSFMSNGMYFVRGRYLDE